MNWEKFKILFAQHFRVNAEVSRGLQDCDFDLLQYKIQCNDCKPAFSQNSPSASNTSMSNSVNDFRKSREFYRNHSLEFEFILGIITFKNMLCPHLRYECGSTNVRFSVWRGMLELLQIFQDVKTNVRKLWEKNLIMGFLEFDQVCTLYIFLWYKRLFKLSWGLCLCWRIFPLWKDVLVAKKNLKFILNLLIEDRLALNTKFEKLVSFELDLFFS